VLSGPAAGVHIPFPSDSFLIGRAADGPGNLMRDPELSRQHARLSLRDGRTLIEDLGSTNGTFVNGAAVTEPVTLSEGDEIRLGTSELRVEATAAAPRSFAAGESRLQQQMTRMSVVPAAAGEEKLGFTLRIEAGPAAGKRITVDEELIVGRAERGAGQLDGDP